MNKALMIAGLLLVGCSTDFTSKQKQKVEEKGYKVLLAASRYTIAEDSTGRHYVFLHIKTTDIEEVIAVDTYCKEAK